MTKVATQRNSAASAYEDVKKYARHMLRNTVFVGTYHEKRFVESLKSYRDVINISKDEEKFIGNLLNVRKKVAELLTKPWIGITDPGTVGATCNYSLWVELSEEIFGEYWFNVRSVEFFDNEFRLKLEIIRPVQQISTSCENVLDFSDIRSSLRELIKDFPPLFFQNLIYFYNSILTVDNIKKTMTFILLLVGTLLAAGVDTVKYLLEYMLKLIREISALIKVLTPIIICSANVIKQIIFGLYHMIVMLFQRKPPQNVYNLYYNPEFGDPRQTYLRYPNTRDSRSQITYF